jgi:Ankyrin repeats (many copies)
MPWVFGSRIRAFILVQFLPVQDSRTPLHWAASMGHLDVVTYLLANGAEVDKADDSGWTALHNSGRRAIPAQFSTGLCFWLSVAFLL